MKYLNLNLNETYYKKDERTQVIEMIILCLAGFMISFLVGHPQILVGALVNAFLIRCALTLPNYKVLPVVMAPSIGAAARGILFGPFTPYLIPIMPFIWAGNMILVYAFKIYAKNKRNYWTTLLISSTIKAGFLFTAANILYTASIIPAAIVSAMGIMQATTAIIGGTIVYIQLKIEQKYSVN